MCRSFHRPEKKVFASEARGSNWNIGHEQIGRRVYMKSSGSDSPFTVIKVDKKAQVFVAYRVYEKLPKVKALEVKAFSLKKDQDGPQNWDVTSVDFRKAGETPTHDWDLYNLNCEWTIFSGSEILGRSHLKECEHEGMSVKKGKNPEEHYFCDNVHCATEIKELRYTCDKCWIDICRMCMSNKNESR